MLNILVESEHWSVMTEGGITEGLNHAIKQGYSVMTEGGITEGLNHAITQR